MVRVVYAAGPGNVLGTYEHWATGKEDPSQVSVTYSSQFYTVCQQLGASGYIISFHSEATVVESGQFKIEHRPHPAQGKSGIQYHLESIRYGLGLIASILRWQAEVAVIADGTTHWFVLAVLPYLGVEVIPSLHCALWKKHASQSKVNKLIWRLNRFLLARSYRAFVVSQDIGNQVKTLMGSNHPPVQEFIPIYRQEEFSPIPPPPADRSPFNVLFVGRMVENKGVFDLLEIAKRFAAEGRDTIRFDLCGSGPALEALRQAARDAGLENSFICHGYCGKPEMHERFSQSHVVIAPTTTDFVEGFCKAVAEGVLVGRPVVTSTVCPALDYVRSGVVEVQPDDVKGYGDALLKLYDDRAFYDAKRQGCLEVQSQFYDCSRSWEAALKSALMSLQEKTKSRSKSLLPRGT